MSNKIVVIDDTQDNYGQQPFAIVTDNEMSYPTGPEVIIYLSPKTNLEDDMIYKAVEQLPYMLFSDNCF